MPIMVVPAAIIVWNARWTTLTGGRSSSGISVEADDLRVERVAGEQRAELRDLDAAAHLAVDQTPPIDHRGVGPRSRSSSSIAASFDGCSVGEPLPGEWPISGWLSAAIVANTNGNGEPESVRPVAAALAACRPRRRRRRESPSPRTSRPTCAIELRPQRVVEHRAERIDVGDRRRRRIAGEPGGIVHPGVDGDDAERAEQRRTP